MKLLKRKKIWTNNFYQKGTFFLKTLEQRHFGHGFTYKTILRGILRQLSSTNLALNIFLH